jgi:hypothetical protein
MKPVKDSKFKRLPEKNIEEIQRLLKNLGEHLKEIEQRFEIVQLEQIRKRLNRSQI